MLKDSHSDSLFVDGLREYYAVRPVALEHVTLPQYAAEYKWYTCETTDDHRDLLNNESDEDIADILDEDVAISASLFWKDLRGHKIWKRTTPLIPRWRRLTLLDGETFYHQKLMLS